jgi:hypothetical protein
MLKAVRTFAVVTIITLMIWVYAEGENVKLYTLDVDIEFTPARDVSLIIKPAQVSRARLTVRCSAEKFAQLEGRTRNDAIPLTVKGWRAEPDQTIVLKDAMERRSLVSDLGINIVDVQPSTVQIHIEQSQELSLPVQVVADGVELADTPSVDKAVVTVNVPASLASALEGRKFEARLDPARLASLQVGVPHTLTVGLTPPEPLLPVLDTLALPEVRVTLTIRSQSDSVRLASVPVWQASPPAAMARFNIVLDNENEFRRDITLTGPADAIGLIRRGETKVVAELRLTGEDLERLAGKEAATANVVLTLPPGVVASPTPTPVTFKVTRKE